MNVIVLSGNVGKDPEMKYFDSGKVVANFPLAVSIYDREKKENKTVWFKCAIWGKKAEFVGEYIKKGSKVIVSGSIYFEEFKDKDGNQRTVNCVNAGDVESCDKKSDGGNNTKPKQDERYSDNEQLVEFGEDEIPF